MIKRFIFVLALLLPLQVLAVDETVINRENSIQKRIDEIGFKVLNSNKIEKRVVFTYSKDNKLYKGVPEVTKRQIVVYDDAYKYTDCDDEVAAMLARKISDSVKSFDGAWGGFFDAAQVKMAPKKYEMVADKRAVDYVVGAGYNPLALITYITKSCPQRRQDTISTNNLTSKRLAEIYEYIFVKYPYYLKNNTYLTNEYYQNFLLTSIENRKKLEQKLKSNSKKKVDYE